MLNNLCFQYTCTTSIAIWWNKFHIRICLSPSDNALRWFLKSRIIKKNNTADWFFVYDGVHSLPDRKLSVGLRARRTQPNTWKLFRRTTRNRSHVWRRRRKNYRWSLRRWSTLVTPNCPGISLLQNVSLNFFMIKSWFIICIAWFC